MSTKIRTALVATLTLVACLHAVASRAQGIGVPRPYKGLFGGSAADPQIHHSLDASLSLLGGYDDNVVAGAGAVPDSPLYQTGFYTGVTGNLGYSWQGKNVQVGANFASENRYYADASEFIGVTQSGGIGFSAALGEKTKLAANQSVSFTPAYLYGLFPGAGTITPGAMVGEGDPLGDEHVLIYDTSATFTRDISQRGSLEALGEFRYSDYNHAGTITTDLKSYAVGARYRHSLTRYASLRLGYVYRKGSYGYVADVTRPTTVHDIDVGIDYRRPLSLTRRTTLDFAVGSSIVNTPVDSVDSELQYRVVGDVNLTHQMGRTWSANLAYNRGVGFAEGFGQPVFSDGVTGSLSGFFSRRVDFNAIGGLSIGQAGVTSGTSARDFKAYTASAKVRYALASMWALFAEYSYYKHDLGNVLIVADGVPQNLDRNSVNGGVTLWFPLLRKK